MSSYTKYVSEISKKEFSQKSHLDKHLKSDKYKLQEENFKLKLNELSKKKYSKNMEPTIRIKLLKVWLKK
ncbi:MAG: hypothetical protein CMF62_03600 [Magnetococcales bacterium]|nr:hypothetical protein [Magnetococcales bacterium]